MYNLDNKSSHFIDEDTMMGLFRMDINRGDIENKARTRIAETNRTLQEEIDNLCFVIMKGYMMKQISDRFRFSVLNYWDAITFKRGVKHSRRRPMGMPEYSGTPMKGYKTIDSIKLPKIDLIPRKDEESNR